jgi:5,10-methylene-tetrahydrofolate dehydrogenase/methenyl tetrahydrofolate cyclohydrolase
MHSSFQHLKQTFSVQKHNATVTRVHMLTKNPEKYTRKADIVISAAGCPNLIRGDWLKPNAVVLDVGINHILVII